MPGRSRSWSRPAIQVPRVVVAACVAFAALAGCWSALVPLTEAPDEPAHLALVLHLADGHGYPRYDGLHNPVAIIRLCSTYAAATRACPRPGEPVTPTSTRQHPREDAPDKADRPAWDDAGGDAALGQLNQMPQHPPLYYEAMASVLKVERAIGGGPWSTDRELALLRLVNALLVAPLPALAWWAARRLGLDNPTAITAAFVPFGLPMLTHIGSTLNNDNLLTLAGAALVALLAGVVRGDRRWQTGVAIGVVTGAALLTKAFAALFPVLIVAAYALGWWNQRRTTRAAAAESADEAASADTGWRPTAVALGVAGAVTAALSAWWYVHVRLDTGRFAPTIEEQKLTTALRPPGFQAHLGSFLVRFGRDLDQRFWGSFGWYSVRLSTGLTYLLTAVLAAALATALVGGATSAAEPAAEAGGDRDDPPVDPPTRVDLAFLLLPAGLLVAFVAQHAWSLHVRTSKYQFIQGRYLFAGITGVAVVAAVGVRRWAGRWAPVAVLGSAAALQAWAAYRVLAGYWGGPGLGPRGQLRALVAWSAWPGEALGLLAVASLASVGWLLWEVARATARPTSPITATATPT